MNKIQASKELKRQWEDEETVIDVARMFETWNWKDVLVAVKKAAEQHFGRAITQHQSPIVRILKGIVSQWIIRIEVMVKQLVEKLFICCKVLFQEGKVQVRIERLILFHSQIRPWANRIMYLPPNYITRIIQLAIFIAFFVRTTW